MAMPFLLNACCQSACGHVCLHWMAMRVQVTVVSLSAEQCTAMQGLVRFVQASLGSLHHQDVWHNLHNQQLFCHKDSPFGIVA